MKKKVFKKHLESAEKYFSAKNYDKALFEYSLARAEDPTSQDVRVGILLCDLAYEMEVEAHSLFDYYMIAKKENAENASELLEKIILSIDGALSATAEILMPSIKNRIDYENAISYEDFQEIVKKRGDFKRAFEDIMFSTRVIISEKKDFINFLDALVMSGFNDMALNYLESASAIFPSSKKIRELFDKLNQQREPLEAKTPKKL
ncbi:MAG TPA: tetratricopeptide repeat protein [Campylobacterales bacterium]|nr:tetratricopeptide repeat protein [Campylobacterales bacterium]